MSASKVSNIGKFLITITFLLMVIVNFLANALPINGQGTGQISDAYPNLFTPIGLTFAIWGVIYFLLAAHTLYQLGFWQPEQTAAKASLLAKIGVYFSLSSLANAAWVFTWHYRLIPLSMLLMVVILICLIQINQAINRERLSDRERLFVRLPFSVYFGWITVATIANATVLLVSWGWNGFGLSEAVWAVIILTIGMVIGSITMLKNWDMAYGLVLIWAYVGIWLKHTSPVGFAGQHPAVVNTALICIIFFVVAELYLVFAKKSRGI